MVPIESPFHLQMERRSFFLGNGQLVWDQNPALLHGMSSSDSQPTRSMVCIALGSNLGDRAAHLQWALDSIKSLPRTHLVASSKTFETEPHGPVPQGPFLNAAAVLATTHGPRQLLEALQNIERQRGRERSGQVKWGPRILDLDILLFADRTVNEPGLTIPHPHLHERTFVLEPLVGIAPDWIVPPSGRTVGQLLADLRGDQASRALASNRENN